MKLPGDDLLDPEILIKRIEALEERIETLSQSLTFWKGQAFMWHDQTRHYKAELENLKKKGKEK